MVLSKDEMFLYEEVDLKALKIIKDNFDFLYDSGKLGRFVDAKNGYSVIQDKAVVFDMLNEFYAIKRKTMKQLYKYATGITWGRMFSMKTSLQGISRVIRQTISKDIYWDIDISNAHPNILYQYCLNNKLKVPTLKKYIEKRDELLADLIGLIDGDKVVSRDEAKTIPLAIINGAKRSNIFPEGECPAWISLLEYEVKEIFNHFKETPAGKKFHNRAKRMKEWNVEGSTLNYYLCEQENEILCVMYEFAKSVGLRVGVFCFDGMMVYKREGEASLPEKYLRGMEEEVKNRLNYDLKICVKPMTEFISLNGLSEKESDDEFRMTDRYCADVFYREVGENAFVHTTESGWYMKNEDGSYEKTSVEDTLYLTIQDRLMPLMRELCEKANASLDENEAKRNTKDLLKLESLIFTKLVEENLRGKYKRKEVFEPNVDKLSGETFNVFNGFVASKEPTLYNYEESVKPFVEHIEYLCGESSKYVLDWISHLIQKPWEKVGVSIVIVSRFQGNGKDTICEMIKAMIGNEYCTNPDNLGDNLFGRFNGNLRYKFLCHLPECKGSDIRPYWNRFKQFIVSKTDTTQFKRLDLVTTTSYVRYFITSNDNNPVPIEPSDRRFNYIETEAEPKDKAYYRRLYDLLDNEEAVRCLYKYFKERDISQVNWDTDRVQSTTVVDLKVQNTPLTTLFYTEFFEDGNKLLDDKGRISTDDLWSAYISYCAKCNITNKMSKISFSMNISKHSERYGVNKLVYKTDGKTIRGYTINLDEMEKGLIKDGIFKKEEQEEFNRIRLLKTGRKEMEDEDSGVESGKPPM